jgi:hypothetical protein
LTSIPRIPPLPHTFFEQGHRTTFPGNSPLFFERLLPGLTFQNPFLFFSGVVSCASSLDVLTRQVWFFSSGIRSLQVSFNENEDSGNRADTVPAFFGSPHLKNTQVPAYFGNFLQRDENPRVFMRHAG